LQFYSLPLCLFAVYLFGFLPLFSRVFSEPKQKEIFWSSALPGELKVISDFYDLMLWTIQHCEKFPRHHRYSLGISIEPVLRPVGRTIVARGCESSSDP